MNATLAGLLQACAEAPEDGIPSLILADWLDDHDQPERAELVRLQSRLADWVPDAAERAGLLERCDRLIAQNQERWLSPLQGLCVRSDFSRGLARIWVTSRRFTSVAFGEAMNALSETALIEQVRILNCKSLSRVASRPWLANFPSLSLAQLGLTPGSFDPLITGSQARSLVALDLSGNTLDDSDALQLCQSELFAQLSRLELRNTHLSDRSVRAILDRAGPRLRDLDLIGHSPLATAELSQRKNPGRLMNSLGMEFVQVPAGTFLMGSAAGERGALSDQYPRHTVRLTRPYWMGRFAVTQAQYSAVMNENPSRFTTNGSNLPAENIDYERAVAFCRTLSEMPAERAAGRSYRLPTEAEWEHACRGGTFTAYYWGEDANVRLYNFRGRFDSNEPEQRHPGRPMPVGSYPPNPFGLYEMHGNIWEWTSDYYSSDWYAKSPGVDPVGPSAEDGDNGTRTIRGGCWHAVGICCRSAHRFGEEVETQDDYTGFRVVLVPAGAT